MPLQTRGKFGWEDGLYLLGCERPDPTTPKGISIDIRIDETKVGLNSRRKRELK